MTPPTELVVLVDKQEKDAALCPDFIQWTDKPRGWKRIFKVRFEPEDLRPYGCDYLLKGFHHVGRIEKKRGADELGHNMFSKDRTRFLKSLAKLKNNCLRPILHIDCPAVSFNTKYCTVPSQEVAATLYRWCYHTGVWLWWFDGGSTVDSRKRLGEHYTLLLWTWAWEHLHEQERKIIHDGNTVSPPRDTPTPP